MRALIFSLTLVAASVSTPAIAAADGLRDIELRRLFEPTPAELGAERSGRIYIYDGLNERDVARALEEEFARVDSMMFIRVEREAPAAAPAVDAAPVPAEGAKAEKAPAQYYDDGC